MKYAKTVVCQAIGLAMSIVLLGGCESSQQTGYLQEKRELQEKIKAQQGQIDDLNHSVKTTADHLFQVMTQLGECKALYVKAEGKKKEDTKLTRKPARKRVPRTRTNPKPRPKTSTTKKKAGCPCKQRRQTR